MNISESNISCGVTQLYDLDGQPANTIEQLLFKYESTDWLGTKPNVVEFAESDLAPQYIFSDRVNYQCGAKLAAFIKKNSLGEVVASKSVKNRKFTNALIKTWIWTPSLRGVRAYWNKNMNENYVPKKAKKSSKKKKAG